MSNNPGPSSMHPDDPKFADWCVQQLEDEDALLSDDEESHVSESEHETETDQSADEDEERSSFGDKNYDPGQNGNTVSDDVSNSNFFYGREKSNKMRWSKNPPPSNVRTRKHNLVMNLPGLRGNSKLLGEVADPLEVWQLLFTDDIISEIVTCTNRKLAEIRAKYKRQTDLFLKDLDIIEMKAFLGLLIYTEAFKAGRESIHALFSTDGTGRDVFRSTMSKQRFELILAAIRFDDLTDRKERMKEDKAAAISHLFNTFIQNCQRNFSIGTHACVDESLVAFRGRCSFKVYYPKKPGRYGVKLLSLTDARTSYLYNAYIYSGKGSDSFGLSAEEKRLKVPTQAVVRLVKPIEKSNRNVTADNWFSSMEVVTELKKRGLTYLGTLKKNKPMIPTCFLSNKQRDVDSSLYGYGEDVTLLSYVPKKNKVVLLVSSMHHSEANDLFSGKPEMIADYNMTKGGVDSLDKKCENYSANRRTRRWPVAVFYIW